MTRLPIWTLPPEPPRDEIENLARLWNVPHLVARLLWRRGFVDREGGERFLRPGLEHLVDPFRLAGMGAATERILRALEGGERIGVFGDFGLGAADEVVDFGPEGADGVPVAGDLDRGDPAPDKPG